jgi:hypothetical protein
MKKTKSKLVINHQSMSLKSLNIVHNKKIAGKERKDKIMIDFKIETKEVED